MKKILLSLAVVFSLAFTACDPVEDFTENTASNFTGDQIDATLIQENGDNLVKVTVHTPGTAQISNGKQTIKANYADLILREMGANTVYIKMLTANGDIVEVLSARNFEELYGFHFVDVTLRFIDYADAPPLECKLLLEALHSESPSLTRDESQRLFTEVLADYADLPTKAEQLNGVRSNPYYNALQVKFAYSLTCHKTQGGQWPVVFVDQGSPTDDMIDREYLRWLYTALTRATERVYLLNFNDRFFEK